jgi:hypothetical protein
MSSHRYQDMIVAHVQDGGLIKECALGRVFRIPPNWMEGVSLKTVSEHSWNGTYDGRESNRRNRS